MARANVAAWEELDNIDYFLEHLARAVERGDVARESYDRLAPRYLQRRQDLVEIIQGPTTQVAEEPPAAQPAYVRGQPAVEPATQPPPRTTAAPHPWDARPTMPAASSREPLKWTTVLTFTGAFLVIIAAAIFAVATWDLYSVVFKLVFLGLLTAGFYVAGSLVRERLDLTGGGIALTVVASAMLLFDGWIAIDGYNMQGAWPWVGWLLVCTLAYWYTETRIAGSFFGVLGATAQIAWWWLLGQGLGWQASPRLAGLAVVALLWAVASRLAYDRKPVASLATVLQWASPVLFVGVTVGLVLDFALGDVGWVQIISAVVAAAASTIGIDMLRLPRGLGSPLQLVVFVAVLGAAMPGAEVGHAVVMFVAAVAWLVHEAYRGGWGYGALALLAEAFGWLLLASRFEWAADVTVAVLGLVAVSWVLAGVVIRRRAPAKEPGALAGAESLEVIATAGGWLLLAASSLAMPFSREVLPLAAVDVAARDVALPGLICALWFSAAFLRRREPEGILATGVGVAASFYLLAAVCAWVVPDWHSALYASALLGLAAAWLALRVVTERFLGMPKTVFGVALRVATLVIVFAGVMASEVFFDARAWQVALLLGLAGLIWLADALTSEERPGLIVSAALFVACATVAGWWHWDAEAAGIAGASTGAVLAAGGLAARSRRGWRDAWPWGAALAALAAAAFAVGDVGSLAAALALAALAWAFASLATPIPEGAFGAAILGSLALLSTLAHIDGAPWITVVALSSASATLLVPSALLRDGKPRRTARALAVAGLALALVHVLVGLASKAGGATGWADIGEQGLAAALCVLGGYVTVGSMLHDLEPGIYAGPVAVIAAYWVELGAFDLDTLELYTTVPAVYVAVAGYWWASRDIGRSVPVLTDMISPAIGLIPPLLAALGPTTPQDAARHALWVVALSLAWIGAGVGLRVRAYFLGGVGALLFIAFWRTWVYLMSFWWLLLGIIGIAMLVVALTWERQQMIVRTTSRRVQDALSDWR
ncbi:MAG: hypothetical protein Q8K99_09100 [Actinomycetota bacterium]|nr:hypothetical protein [Actinomycetota bacterium]